MERGWPALGALDHHIELLGSELEAEAIEELIGFDLVIARSARPDSVRP